MTLIQDIAKIATENMAAFDEGDRAIRSEHIDFISEQAAKDAEVAIRAAVLEEHDDLYALGIDELALIRVALSQPSLLGENGEQRPEIRALLDRLF